MIRASPDPSCSGRRLLFPRKACTAERRQAGSPGAWAATVCSCWSCSAAISRAAPAVAAHAVGRARWLVRAGCSSGPGKELRLRSTVRPGASKKTDGAEVKKGMSAGNHPATRQRRRSVTPIGLQRVADAGHGLITDGRTVASTETSPVDRLAAAAVTNRSPQPEVRSQTAAQGERPLPRSGAWKCEARGAKLFHDDRSESARNARNPSTRTGHARAATDRTARPASAGADNRTARGWATNLAEGHRNRLVSHARTHLGR
jgi:hypothetical protein